MQRMRELFEEIHKRTEGKTILDLGCNMGSMSFEACNLGAKSVVGYDVIPDRIEVANGIATFEKLPAEFRVGNVDEDHIEGEYDITFCLALDGWVKNPDKLYKIIGRCTKEKLYFETHIGAGQGQTGKPEVDKVTNILKDIGFKTIEYINKKHDDMNQGREQFRQNYRAIN